jgi:hypothetical protein
MKMSKLLASALVLGAIAFGTYSISFVEKVESAALATRSSYAAGIQVEVTPKTTDPNSKVWEFAIALNTHVTPLTVDLAKTSVLTDDAGHSYAPLAWKGDAPGGHHRKGVLQFPAPAGTPKVIELRIKGVAGPPERVFKWELK